MSYRIGDLERVTIHIGRVAENEYTQIRIDAGEIYAEYPHAAAALTVQPPAGEAYPAVVTREGDLVIWDVPDSALAQEGDGEIQLTFVADSVVVKSAIAGIRVCRSLIGEGETPDPLEDFLAEAGAALTAIPETIDAALEEAKESGEFDGPPGPQGERGPRGYTGADGRDGTDGADGYSPTASVSKSGKTATITITDKNGTTTAQISDGEDGQGADLIDDTTTTATDKAWSAKKTNDTVSDLLSAISGKIDEPASEGTSGQVLTTDGNGGRSWTTVQGGGGGAVDDVRIDGTSIVTNGIANIPVGENGVLGLIMVGGSTYGLRVNTNGVLVIEPASSGDIKGGANSFKPVMPNRQHESAFYGLATAAGDSTQASSANAVGTYTENAKSAISQMLDAPETVSGSTPTITAKAGVRYICGEVATLTIVVPASGIIDVTFTSGSTATVLTITPPTGQTIKWANGFDPSSLEANKNYEINIMDCLGVGAAWT